ncbi:MAG: hypothetical protein U0Q18_21110 [Bryobacteraceae bacterium]
MPETIAALLSRVSGKHACAKFDAIKTLRVISEHSPHRVYPEFDTFAALLRSDNGILRWNAMLILGNIACDDAEQKLDLILDDYLAPIAGPHLIDAANAMRGAAAIACAKPYLADAIVAGILRVETAMYATPECRKIAIGHAITALDRLITIATDRHAIHRFVVRQLENSRPATRKKAETFLRKHPIEEPALSGKY